MILNNAKIYSDGSIREGAILITDGIIDSIKFNCSSQDYAVFVKKIEMGKKLTVRKE